jgi:hypothetical protein
MKDTLLEEQSSFLDVSRVTFERFSWYSTIEFKAFSAASPLTFKAFFWKAITINQHNSLLTMWGWFLLVKNERHFSGRTLYILCCVSASIRGIFLKLHILNSKPIPYKKFKFFLLSVKNEGHFISGSWYFLGSILAPYRGIFLQLPV